MQVTSLMPGSRKGTYRAVRLKSVLSDDDEFWCLVDSKAQPAEPTARSKPEFRLKLLAAGLDFTGRTLNDWTDSGVPSSLCREFGGAMFEVAEAGSELQAGPARRPKP